MTEPVPTDPAGARAFDDAIEAARAEEALADKRTALRDRLAALTPEGREVLRALVDLAGYCEDAYRHDPDLDDREAAFDLIDEAEAYASGRDDLAARFERPGVVSSATNVEIDLGSDFRGLTATSGALAEAMTVHADDAAQVWAIVRVGPDHATAVDHMVALDRLVVREDGVVHLLGIGVQA